MVGNRVGRGVGEGVTVGRGIAVAVGVKVGTARIARVGVAVEVATTASRSPRRAAGYRQQAEQQQSRQAPDPLATGRNWGNWHLPPPRQVRREGDSCAL